MQPKLFVLLDYNLSRVDDVRIMTKRAQQEHGLTTVLLRAKPGSLDRSLADHVIDLDPLDPEFVERAVRAIRALGEPRAVLPFSDNAVASGAAVVERLGLRGDSARLAEAAFSKIAYRQAEAEVLSIFPQEGVSAPRWCTVSSLAEVLEFAKSAPQGFVIKPSCEGNNRGVVKVAPGDDVAAAFAEVVPYLEAGALCEALIELPEEYSFDGIGELTFITKKNIAKGRYPVEHGQTVPARLPPQLQEAIVRAGTLANVIVGQRLGPFHNEIKLDPEDGRSAVIEPNRRPAGMRIWHLAGKVYGINFFELWVDTMLGTASPIAALQARGSAGIRMLAAPLSGRLKPNLDEEKILLQILARKALTEITRRHQLVWSDFKITAAPDAQVTNLIDDNSKFIAHITLYCPDAKVDIDPLLELFAKEWSVLAEEFIISESQLKKVS
jgi:biotin carboxylase